MGSSDEEEMRHVRRARGFQTRMERAAAAAAEAAAAGGRPAAATRGAAAEADAAAAAALRRAARRAVSEYADSSSSSDDEHVSPRGGRRAAADVEAAAAAAKNGCGISVCVSRRSSGESPENRSSSAEDVGRNSQREKPAAGRPTKAAAAEVYHHGVQRPTVSPEFQKHTTPLPGSSSSDEDDCPGPRPLYSSSRKVKLFSRGAEDSSSCSDSDDRLSGSSSSSNSSSTAEALQDGEAAVHDRLKSTSRTAATDAAEAAEISAEAPGAIFEKASVWQFRKGTRPAGIKGVNTAEEEEEDAEESGGEDKEEVGEEEDDDFLFEQVPEEDLSSTGGALPPAEAEQQQAAAKQHPADSQLQQSQEGESAGGGKLKDGKQKEDEKVEERDGEQLLQQRKTGQKKKQQQQSNWVKQQQQVKQEIEQDSEEKKEPLQHGGVEHREEESPREDDEEGEEEEEDLETEKERCRLGLPRAFGYAAAADGYASRNTCVKRLIRETCSSNSNSCSSSSGSSSEATNGRLGGGLVDDDDSSNTGEEAEAFKKWRSLGLPVSLEVDIPAHVPGQVSAFAVNCKANRLATGGSDGLVRLWDFQGLHLENLRSYRSFCPAEKHKVEALAFSFRNDLLLVAAGDAVCRVYTAQAAELLHTTTRGDMYIRDAANTKGHTHTVLDCCWHPLQPQQFFSCGLDATVRLWDLNAKPYGILQTLPHVSCFKTVPSTACGSGRAAAESFLRSSSSSACCTCCVVAPTAADCLVVGCADGSLQMWGSLSSRRVFGRPDAIVRDAHSVSPLLATVSSNAAFPPAAAAAASASASAPVGSAASRACAAAGDLRSTGELTQRIDGAAAAQRRATAAAAMPGARQSTAGNNSGKGYGVSALHFFSDDRRLVSRGEDGSVAVWDLRNFKRPVARAPLPLSNSVGGRGGLCLSPDEKYVCLTTQGESSPTLGEASAAPATGAVQVLHADDLSLVTALPVAAATGSVSAASSASSAAPDGGGRDGTAADATLQVKKESEEDDRDRDNSISEGRSAGRRQVRQPLRVLWPSETNQLLVSCSDGCVCVLFDRQMSRKGILLSVDAAKGSRRRHAAEQEAAIMYTQPYILVPGQLPEGFKETRDGQIIRVKPRGRERQRLFLEKQKTIIPPIPAKEGYAGANVGGGNRSQHLLRQLGLLNPPPSAGEDDDDPVAALRAYATKVESSGRESQLISRAYAATQPHAVLDFDAEEEEAAIAAGVASGAVEDSGRLLQQKTRCPRCALRMCQCGYMEEQNAAAQASKRQRV